MMIYYHTLLEKYNDKYQVLSLKQLFMSASNPSLAIKDFGIISYGLIDLKTKYVETSNNDVLIAYNDNNKEK